MSHWEELNRLEEQGYVDEQDRIASIIDRFLDEAHPGKLYAFKIGVMPDSARCFYRHVNFKASHVADWVHADPFCSVMFLEHKKMKYRGDRWFKFLIVDASGHSYSAWLEAASIEYLGEYKR